jgi:hypothetical protein
MHAVHCRHYTGKGTPYNDSRGTPYNDSRGTPYTGRRLYIVQASFISIGGFV